MPIFREHREYFYDWCDIGSIYGASGDCLWGGGRVGFGDADPVKVKSLMEAYNISMRLTFSNSMLRQEHLSDPKCNDLCAMFEGRDVVATCDYPKAVKGVAGAFEDSDVKKNGIIIHSDLLLEYIKKKYPGYYFVSSTTKVLTDFEDLCKELDREDFDYVVPDFRLNKEFDKLSSLTAAQKDKVEFLCNECCFFGCYDRKKCYENVSLKCLGQKVEDHICVSPDKYKGYRFSDAMNNPGFIGIDDIQNTYLPMGFSNFKIEGRSLGSAIILEFLLYYMTKPSYQLKVREEIYLDSSLDLF
nr:hypothetical protein [Butyrivibrio fibrisolvens]